MNEIALSNNLNQIELEINHHKQIAGQSIWEIGRRLNHVKENDLQHGDFINWVEDKLQMDRTDAYRFMRVSKELPNDDTWQHLGSRALYLISTLPEDERTREHVTDNGETKTPNEMTVRELQDLKKQLNRAEIQLKIAKENEQTKQKDIDRLIEKNNELANQEPKVIEKKVIPDDYQVLKERHEYWKNRAESLDSSLKIAQSKYEMLESTTAGAQELKKQIDSLNDERRQLTQAIDAASDLHDFEKMFNEFFDKNMAPMKFKGISKYLHATNAVDRVHDLINLADAWVEDMRRLVPKSGIKVIEGEFEDE